MLDTQAFEAKRNRVEQLSQFGATEEDIATELQISLRRLKKLFRQELKRGRVTGKHEMLQTLYETAQSGSNLAATSMWVKSRCGWRDSGVASDSAVVIQSILEIEKVTECPAGQQL